MVCFIITSLVIISSIKFFYLYVFKIEIVHRKYLKGNEIRLIKYGKIFLIDLLLILLSIKVPIKILSSFVCIILNRGTVLITRYTSLQTHDFLDIVDT